MAHQHDAGRKTAGAFDIRNVIGSLLGLYGIILLLTAAFHGSAPVGTHNNDNWWAGIVLLVVGAIFMLWARLRPIEVSKKPAAQTQPQSDALLERDRSVQ